MSSQTDSQNSLAKVEIDIQEPDFPSQTSSSSAEVISLNVLPTLGIGPSGEVLIREDLDQVRSSRSIRKTNLHLIDEPISEGANQDGGKKERERVGVVMRLYFRLARFLYPLRQTNS
ncbi:hypothetical protein Adt_27224 [Abeliophyllum distichum]|uniref:Uncharacterized protein n=1 Tax=Abeliophyllum distichum TaxID=126358 RepID=A0ABD1RTW1_9LAMI